MCHIVFDLLNQDTSLIRTHSVVSQYEGVRVLIRCCPVMSEYPHLGVPCTYYVYNQDTWFVSF